MYRVYTDSVWLWGVGVWGVELYCRPYSAGVLHSVSDQIQNLQIDSPPQTKMTTQDDIEGLVSLKFLRQWSVPLSELRPPTPYPASECVPSLEPKGEGHTRL
jgi:hypothetical protein